MSANLSTEDWKKLESDLEKVLTPLFAELFKDAPSKGKENNNTYEKQKAKDNINLLYKQEMMLEELEEIEDTIKSTDHLYLEDDYVDIYRRAYELAVKINFIDEFLTEQENN